MTKFRPLQPDDTETYAAIIAGSDRILEATLRREKMPRRLPARGDWFGKMGVCLESSDAVTRAAHALGVVASREMLVGWHFITSFAPLDQLPTDDDLILDRTWGQFDPKAYGRRPGPFFGPRRELAALVPDNCFETFIASGVSYRQVIHRANGWRPNAHHIWLNTSPEEIAAGEFQIGEASFDAYPDRDWS